MLGILTCLLIVVLIITIFLFFYYIVAQIYLDDGIIFNSSQLGSHLVVFSFSRSRRFFSIKSTLYNSQKGAAVGSCKVIAEGIQKNEIREHGLLAKKEGCFASPSSIVMTSPYTEQLNYDAPLIKEQADGSIMLEFHDNKLIISREFMEWFRGFTDAEGCFSITNNRNSFSFKFYIGLHIDDIEVLNYIHNILKIGSVRISKSGPEVFFEVRTQSEIKIIIAIFAKYNLNTTKHLDFKAFEQAFLLFLNNSSSCSKEEKRSQIKNIKNSMNTKRFSFDLLESHKINITPSWLLGFVEGDGSFSYSRGKGGSLSFYISQKRNKTLLNAIRDFLQSLVPQDKKVSALGDIENAVHISVNKEYLNLYVNHTAFIELVIIPLFNSMIFRSKKGLDYFDWVAIFNIRQKGFHHTPEGQELIDRILSQMNNNRLSTSGQPQIVRVKLIADIINLLSMPSNYEYRDDGKVWNIHKNKFTNIEGGKRKAVALLSLDGTIIETFKSKTDCGNFLGISITAVSKRLVKGKPFLYKDKLCLLNQVKN